jgi:hypothetical protein
LGFTRQDERLAARHAGLLHHNVYKTSASQQCTIFPLGVYQTIVIDIYKYQILADEDRRRQPRIIEHAPTIKTGAPGQHFAEAVPAWRIGSRCAEGRSRMAAGEME